MNLPVFGLEYTVGDSLLVGQLNTILPLVRRTDLTIIKTMTRSQVTNILTVNSNNLNDDEVYFVDSTNTINKLTISSSNNAVSVVPLDISIYGVRNKVLNFGSFNYIIFVPSSVVGCTILLIDKTTFTITSSYMTFPAGTPAFSKYGMTKSILYQQVNGEDRYYFLVSMMNPSYNTLSYYILVDNCISRGVGSICTQCPTNTHLTNLSSLNRCVDKGSFPPRYGVYMPDNVMRACDDIGCNTCIDDSTVCTSCIDIDYIVSSGVCIPDTSCIDSLCTQCVNDRYVCDVCDSSLDYHAVDGVCLRTSRMVYYTSTENRYKRESVDWSRVLMTTSNISDFDIEYYRRTYMNYSINMYMDSDEHKYIVVKYSIDTYMMNGSTIVLDATIMDTIESGTYTIQLILYNTTNIYDSNGGKVQVIFYSSTFNYIHKRGEVQQTGLMKTSTLMTGVSDSNHVGAFSLITLLTAIDPTGTVFRFTKTLQMMNKMYFINVNHGNSLDKFLLQTATIIKYDPSTHRPQKVYNRRSYRGKITKQETTLDVVGFMLVKIIVYFISWIIKGAAMVSTRKCKIGKWGIYFCFYWNQVHVLVFNLLFADFMWLAPRTLAHSVNLPYIKRIITALISILLGIDLYSLVFSLFDNKIYTRAYKVYTNKKRLVPNTIDTTGRKDRVNQQSTTTNNNGQQQRESKMIDYEKTYDNISFNRKLADMSIYHMRLDDRVYRSRICRLLLISTWVRLPFVYLIISSSQYCTLLSLLTICTMDMCILLSHIYAYIKYKYIRSVVCFIMDIVHYSSTTIYLMTIILISHKTTYESVDESYQKVGIYSIVISCIVEYILLFMYILDAVIQYVKMRRMMKKNNVHATPFHIIIYHIRDQSSIGDQIDPPMINLKYIRKKDSNRIGVKINHEVKNRYTMQAKKNKISINARKYYGNGGKNMKFDHLKVDKDF